MINKEIFESYIDKFDQIPCFPIHSNVTEKEMEQQIIESIRTGIELWELFYKEELEISKNSKYVI